MEYENKYASKGVAGTGLGLGIAGTALGVLNSNLGKVFANGNPGVSVADAAVPAMAGVVAGLASHGSCNEDHTVNRYEAAQAARIAELETEVKLRDANTYTDSKLLEVYKYFDGRIRDVEGQLCEQKVYNATNTATIGCIANQVNALMGLTKLIVPASNICPEPMPAKNSWTAPTTAASA